MIMFKKVADNFYLYCTCLAIILANAVLPLVKFVETRSVKTNTEVTCENIKSQQHYSLTDMSGTWYGVEILDHVTKGRPIVDTCIKVNIRQQENNYIDLEWRERDFVVNYKFVILDQTRRGKWTSQGFQSVSGTPDGYEYEQFAGNVFITKAADANLVLSFCSVPSKLYSLVLFKTHSVNESQLVTLHELVQRFGMPKPVDIKRYCRNTSQSLELPLSLLLLMPVIIFFVRGLSE